MACFTDCASDDTTSAHVICHASHAPGRAHGSMLHFEKMHIHASSKGILSMVLLAAGTVVGGLANPVTGRTGHQSFSAPAVIAVPESAFHSAENPSCTEEIILQQAQSGGVSTRTLTLLRKASFSRTGTAALLASWRHGTKVTLCLCH